MVAITYKVEIALSTSPALPLASQTWTDVTAKTLTTGAGEPINIRFGRQDEFAQIVPATCSLVLDNTDGRFTPDGTTASAPYLGAITPGRYLRVTATVAGVDYPRFVGNVDAWDIPDWAQAGAHKVIQVRATDRLKRLQNSPALRSVLELETLAAGPVAYWPLSEPAGATAASSITPTAQTDLIVTDDGGGQIAFGAGTGPADGLAAAHFEPAINEDDPLKIDGSQYLQAPVLSPTVAYGAAGVTVSVWFSLDLTPYLDFPVLATLDATSGAYFMMRVDWNGRLEVFSFQSATLYDLLGPSLSTAQTYHAVAVLQRGQPIRVYLDGELLPLGDTLPALNHTIDHVGQVGQTFPGTVSHLAVWDRALTATEVATIHAAGRSALAGSRTDEAVRAAARYLGIPDTEVTTDTGISSIGRLDTQGRSGLAVLQEIQAAEDGAVFADTAGQFQFHGRGRRYNATADLTQSIAGDTFTGIGFRKDDTTLVNDSTAARTGGASFRVVDATSVTAYGSYPDSIEVNVGNDAEARDRAAYRLAARKQPRTRVSDLPVVLTTATAPGTFLALQFGDALQLTGLSADAPALGLLWIEGWTEQIAVDRHTLTFTTTPDLLPGVALWELGGAALGTGTVLAY